MTKPEKDGEPTGEDLKEAEIILDAHYDYKDAEARMEMVLIIAEAMAIERAKHEQAIDQAEKRAKAYREVAIGIVNRNMIADRTEPGEIAKDYSRPASRLIDAEAERILKGEL